MIRILRGAEPSTAEIRDTAFQEGYQQGLLAGQQIGLVRLLQKQQEKQQLRQEQRRESISLALLVAKRILGESIAESQTVSRVIEEALQAAEGKALQLRVHPNDMPAVREMLGERCALVADESLSRGGCWVDTEWGSIDARLETQLSLIAAFLEGELR
jgi:flagellar assembly protein FliH